MRAARAVLRAAATAAVTAAVTAATLAVPAAPAHAAVSLSTRLLTWGVIGLDSNDVSTGPNLFPVGARACNTGSTTATGLTARLVWDSANPYVNVSGPTTVSAGTLAPGKCRDVYVNVAVTRTTAAYLTSRRFHMTFTAGSVSARTATRELYVEKLISQNRNQVLSINGPSTLVLGGSYTITVNAETAPGGYEQVEAFLTLPTSIFRIDAVTMTATAGQSPVTQPYLDACTWVSDPASPDYRECAGTGKAGGTMTVTYKVTVVGTGSGTATTLVYDFSGSSYHYNTDYGTAPNLYHFQVVYPDLLVTKTHTGTSWAAGSTGTFSLAVRNIGASATTQPITLVDTLPAGLTYVSASGGGFSCSASGQKVTCVRTTALQAGATAVVTLTVRVTATAASTVTNVAVVTTPNDPVTTNNRDTDTVPITVPARPPAAGTPGAGPATGPGTPGAGPGSGSGSGSVPGAGPGAGPAAPGAPGAGPGAPGTPGAAPLPDGPLPLTGANTLSFVWAAVWLLLAGAALLAAGVPGPRLVPALVRRARAAR